MSIYFFPVFGIGKEKNNSQDNLNEYYMNNNPSDLLSAKQKQK